MAIALLAQRFGANKTLQTATSTIQPTGTITAGNLLLLFTACGGSSKVPASVTDDAGNTYVVDKTTNDGTRGVAVVRCQVTNNILTSNTITITWSDATSRSVQVWLQEITGASPSDAFDTFQVGSSASSSALSAGPTAALVQANEIVWGIFAWNATHTWTKGATFTDPSTPSLNSTASLEYKIVASTAAVTADGSLEAATAWVGLVVTYTELLASPSISSSPSASLSPSISASPSPSSSISSSVSASPSPSSSASSSRSPSLSSSASASLSPSISSSTSASPSPSSSASASLSPSISSSRSASLSPSISSSVSRSPSASASPSISSSVSRSPSPSSSISASPSSSPSPSPCPTPINVVPPVITGHPKVGFTICCSAGTWDC